MKNEFQIKKDLEMLKEASKLDKKEVLKSVLKDHLRTQNQVAIIKKGTILLDDAGH